MLGVFFFLENMAEEDIFAHYYILKLEIDLNFVVKEYCAGLL